MGVTFGTLLLLLSLRLRVLNKHIGESVCAELAQLGESLMWVFPLIRVGHCPRLRLDLVPEPLSLGFKCRNVQSKDQFFEDHFCVVAQGSVLTIG